MASTLLPLDVQKSVKEVLGTMTDPVTVRLYVKPSEVSSDTMKELWEDIQGLSDKVVVEIRDTVPEGMTVDAMEGAVTEFWQGDEFTGIRYLGIASGHEFGPMVETLTELSTQKAPTLSAEAEGWLSSLTERLHLQVFVTPT